MFNKRNLTKINLLFGALSIMVFVFGFFDIQWRGASLVNNIPDIDILAFAPIKSMLVDLVGQDYGALISNILQLNIIWYIFLVWPVWCFNFVKECFDYGK